MTSYDPIIYPGICRAMPEHKSTVPDEWCENNCLDHQGALNNHKACLASSGVHRRCICDGDTSSMGMAIIECYNW